MFKSVEYSGFDGMPELKAQAERANQTLGEVIHSWRDEVEVVWEAGSRDCDPALRLRLTLSLAATTATATGTVQHRDLALPDRPLLRIAVREVWLDLLDEFIDSMASKVESSFAEQPVEA
jgi:hypothetical protein